MATPAVTEESPEDVCVVCRVDEDDALVVFCDGCDKACHTYCFTGCFCCKKRPNIFGREVPVPDGSWFCKLCSGRAPPLAEGQKPASLVYSFGFNTAGQLGLGDTKNRSTPTLVEDMKSVHVVTAALGGWNSLLLTAHGKVFTCGDGNEGKTGHSDMVHEELNNFRLVTALLPCLLSKGEGNVVSVALGRTFSAAVTSEGHIYTWGNGLSGQLGHQKNNVIKVPKKISAFRQLEIPISHKPNHIALGWDHLAMVGAEEGAMWVAGAGKVGQLGTGTPRNQWVPQVLNPSADLDRSVSYYTSSDEPFLLPRDSIDQLGAGSLQTMALDKMGRIWSWGSGVSGMLGQGKCEPVRQGFFDVCYKNVFRPQVIESLSAVKITQITVGAFHSLALDMDGRVWGWGRNTSGQVGVGNREDVWEPTRIDAIREPMTQLRAGHEHSMASDGELVFAWGANKHGQCGIEPSACPNPCENLPVPVPLPDFQPDCKGSKGTLQIFCGGDHSMLLVTTGYPGVDYESPEETARAVVDKEKADARAKKKKGKAKGKGKGNPAKKAKKAKKVDAETDTESEAEDVEQEEEGTESESEGQAKKKAKKKSKNGGKKPKKRKK